KSEFVSVEAFVSAAIRPARSDTKRRNTIVQSRPAQIVHIGCETSGPTLEAPVAVHGDFGVPEDSDRRDRIVHAGRHLFGGGAGRGTEILAAEVDVPVEANARARRGWTAPGHSPVAASVFVGAAPVPAGS